MLRVCVRELRLLSLKLYFMVRRVSGRDRVRVRFGGSEKYIYKWIGIGIECA